MECIRQLWCSNVQRCDLSSLRIPITHPLYRKSLYLERWSLYRNTLRFAVVCHCDFGQPNIWTSIIKVRKSYGLIFIMGPSSDCLIFIMGIPIPGICILKQAQVCCGSSLCFGAAYWVTVAWQHNTDGSTTPTTRQILLIQNKHIQTCGEPIWFAWVNSNSNDAYLSSPK